jgi:hypothetical protein
LNTFQPLGAYLVDTSSPMSSLYAYVIPNLTQSDSITVQVPPANNTYIGKSLLMIVEYSGPINVTSEADDLRFKFTGNPVIQTIEPSEILMSGGVHVTVSGSNMDTVQNPVMDITTFVTNATTGYSEPETNYSRTICSLKNSSAITCLVPYGIVPSSFFNSTDLAEKSLQGVFHLASSFHQNRGRRTKRAPISELTDGTGKRFEMYLGIIFDALKTFRNFSNSVPGANIGLVSYGVKISISDPMDFVNNKMEAISIYGNSLSTGCSIQDYTVLISDAACNVTSLTDNELQCEPPKKEPPKSTKPGSCNPDSHPVSVVRTEHFFSKITTC